MKKSIVAVFALLLLLSGCQKTPEKGVVTGKNDGTFEAALENTQAPEQTQTPAETAPTAPASVYEDTFSAEIGNVTFHIAVAEPAIETAMPVLQVRPKELDGDTVQRVGKTLFGDAPVYEYTGQMSKAELEELLLYAKQLYADWEYQVQQDPTTNADDQDATGQDYQHAIAYLEQEYADAPETLEQKPCDWQFHPASYYPEYTDIHMLDNGGQYLQGRGEYRGENYLIEAKKRFGDDYKTQSVEFYRDRSGDTEANITPPTPAPQVDMDAAKVTALEMVKAMDVGEWAPVPDVAFQAATDIRRLDNEVLLTPVYNGVPQTYHTAPAIGGGDPYAANYGYEEMIISFDPFGVYAFQWIDMHQLVETVNENVQLLPFSDILAAAKNQMQMTDLSKIVLVPDNIVHIPDDSAVAVEVTEAELGLSRIRMKDNVTDYYLTPTYTFYGAVTFLDASGEPIRVPVYDDQGNETGETMIYTRTVELAVINGVDGTAINVQLGY